MKRKHFHNKRTYRLSPPLSLAGLTLSLTPRALFNLNDPFRKANQTPFLQRRGFSLSIRRLSVARPQGRYTIRRLIKEESRRKGGKEGRKAKRDMQRWAKLKQCSPLSYRLSGCCTRGPMGMGEGLTPRLEYRKNILQKSSP